MGCLHKGDPQHAVALDNWCAAAKEWHEVASMEAAGLFGAEGFGDHIEEEVTTIKDLLKNKVDPQAKMAQQRYMKRNRM